MNSIWTKDVKLKRFPELPGDLQTDTVIIGGGIAGILCAYFLSGRGIDTVVIEKNRICGGQTKNTTAKITSQHGVCYERLIKNFGADSAALYAKSHEEAIQKYEEIIRNLNIDCDFEILPSYLYAASDDKIIETEYEAAKKLGISCKIKMSTNLPFAVKSALIFDNQAQFHPLKFLNKLAENLKIYEDTAATQVEGNTVITNRGNIKAKHIVVATHYPFINVPGYYFARMHQSRAYAIAISGGKPLDGMYYGADGGYSFRSSGDYLIIGGGEHRTGENKEGGRYAELEAAAKRFYGGCSIAARWSAQDCVPIDEVLYAGLYAQSTPDMYVISGFNKWGMTGSMVGANVVCDLITKRGSEYEKLYSPARFNIPASAEHFLTDAAKSVKGLTKGALYIPKTTIDNLPDSHGGIVEADGHKIGVYKDENGRAYIVSTRCTHLGCQLEWNPDEKSWDCPCHGSRFDIEGNPIDNPALRPLERIQ
ncbi:MAG: FAD-dependent oxidoreductase [Clostridia bacterium]|nr:FAD-dependent oxidoreductase [Clostridia bacterium]